MLVGLLKLSIWLATVFVVVATILPLLNSYQWWIRMWDFPRLHLFVAACVLIPAAVLVLRSQSFFVLLMLGVCAAYQARMIYPYTPLADVEIELRKAPDGPQLSLLAANVLMENDEHDRLIALIEEVDPDVLFLMETNARWADALGDTLSQFSTVLSYPLENHYGLIFASKLDVESADTVFLADDETPTLLAELRAPDGRGFHFIGMHPRPPVPGNDTAERDAQIRRAATLTMRSRLPVISMGDFNDVAWSRTAKLFKENGNFRDPRVGRGMLTSFDAKHPILRFPIDQLYVTSGIDLVSFERMRPVGSDHFPMHAVVSINGERLD